MAETKFIRTVSYGGYDKIDVLQRFELLNSTVCDLKSELRTTKLLLEGYKKNADEDKTVNSILAGERTKMTQLEVQNESLNTKLKDIESANSSFEEEIKKLRAENEELKDKLGKAESKLTALEAKNEAAAFSNVFMEAQKSADLLIQNAKTQADELSAKAEKTAESIIAEANKEAENIFYEAKKKAAENIDDAAKEVEEMKVASGNMRSVMLDDIHELNDSLNTVREALELFMKNGKEGLDKYEALLGNTEDTLKKDGVPVFAQPDEVGTELPEKPQTVLEMLKDERAAEEESAKKKSSLERLQKMAEALNGASGGGDNLDKSDKDEKPESEPEAKDKTDKDEKKKGGKIDLAALANQANALKNK